MIGYPQTWKVVTKSVVASDIESTIISCLKRLDCRALSLSGGIDSALTLSYMKDIFGIIQAFTIGISEDHPDVMAATVVAEKFGAEHHIIIPTEQEIKAEAIVGDMDGDAAVRMLYRVVQEHTGQIVACDGLDELMCGYYEHQTCPSEDVYYSVLSRLVENHLAPLDRNSGSVQVLLPFLDPEFIKLASMIPLGRKVDNQRRKKIITDLAQTRLPDDIIERRKYGFCDAFRVK